MREFPWDYLSNEVRVVFDIDMAQPESETTKTFRHDMQDLAVSILYDRTAQNREDFPLMYDDPGFKSAAGEFQRLDEQLKHELTKAVKEAIHEHIGFPPLCGCYRRCCCYLCDKVKGIDPNDKVTSFERAHLPFFMLIPSPFASYVYSHERFMKALPQVVASVRSKPIFASLENMLVPLVERIKTPAILRSPSSRHSRLGSSSSLHSDEGCNGSSMELQKIHVRSSSQSTSALVAV